MPNTPIVTPGTFPVAMLDQTEAWVGIDGCAYRIDSLNEEAILFVIDYSLANAKYLRDKWAAAKQTTYDPALRPRRWMLRRPGIRALLRRLVELENKELTELAFEEASNGQHNTD